MKKPNSLSDLFNQPSTAEPLVLHHFLFLLGTDVNFTEKPVAAKSPYERGETLSYIAQAVVSLIGEQEAAEKHPRDVLSYCSPSVDVLNGPATLGTEVYARIAQAVFLALRAVASGKTTLQITAFSRGAAQALLLMHELDRIKKELTETPGKTLQQILINSPCQKTRKAFSDLFIDNASIVDTAPNRAILKKKLDKLTMNCFLIDPVPGGTVSSYLPYLRWDDPRFYQESSCARHELILCRDERTTCFYPVIPMGMQPIVIPGHHGTSGGNRYTQALDPLPNTIPEGACDTTGVQTLILLKLIHFMDQCTGLFSQQDTTLDLKHTELDAILNGYLALTKKARMQRILEQYLSIKTNNQAYLHFATTSYPFLGKNPASDGSRIIHRHNSNESSMAVLGADMQGSIVNIDHAKLYLSDVIDLDEDADAIQQAQAITTILTGIIDEMQSVGRASNRFLGIISTDDGRALFSNALSTLVDAISQKYLANHLTDDVKSRLMDAIVQPFTQLKGVIGNSDLVRHIDMFTLWQTVLQDGVKRTIKGHYDSIYQQYKQLQQKIKLFVVTPSEFSEAFTEFLNSLSIGNDEDGLFAAIYIKLTKLKPVNITSVKQILSEIIAEIDRNNKIASERKVVLKASLFSEQSKIVQTHLEAHEYTVEQYLLKMQELHSTLSGLDSIYSKLTQLVGVLEPDQDQLQLLQAGFVSLAGRLLKEKSYNLRTEIETIDETFYTEAKNQAIALGATSPAVEDLFVQNASMIATMQGTIDAATQRATEREATILTLQETIEAATLRATKHDATVLTMQEIIDIAERDAPGVAAEILTLRKLNKEQEASILALEAQQIQLGSSKELHYGLLIENKLIPLTKAYLQHLRKEARGYFPKLKNDEDLPESVALSDLARDGYNKLKSKFDRVQSLYRILTSSDIVLPSERVLSFNKDLNTHGSDLKLHRDPIWKAYFKSCLAVIAIIATGIIPGIVGLAAYSCATRRSPLFFSQSCGERYVEEASLSDISLKTR